MTTAGYSSTAGELLAAGWNPLPIGRGRKDHPPRGFTGYAGRDVSIDDVAAWQQTRSAANVAIRLPATVVGIDVDQYGDKTGADQLRDLEDRLGPLPRTVISTARPGTGSGIRFYRIPAGTILAGQIAEHVEVIQHHHRYAVVGPSTHPTGNTYRWELNGTPTTPPAVDDLPELPRAWIAEYRREPRRPRAATDRRPTRRPPGARTGPPILELVAALATAGELRLTAGETEELRRFLSDSPHAAIVVAGTVTPIARLPIVAL